MLKIPKGLKKKKKDKKHKRKGEDELFNEEELEKYRKEHQHQATPADATEQSVENAAPAPSSADKSDEWKKFNALTAGVDTILQKTQEDLDRIKSTSFFQRKAPAPPPPPPPQVQQEVDATNSEGEKVKKKKAKKAQPDIGHSDARPENAELPDLPSEEHGEHEEYDEDEDEEDEPEEEEELVDDSIFETSYVDAVASGELKLAYIPDSPTKEDDFDPFDTSIADKFIESNPRKRYLNLGCAVQVLSGKSDSGAAPSVALERRTPKRRGRPADLLLSSFDEGSDRPADPVDPVDAFDSPVKTLLDDDPSFVDTDSTLLPPAPPPVVAALPTGVAPAEPAVSKLDLSEFEIGVATPLAPAAALVEQHSVESVDDEFEALAAESLAKKNSVSEPPQPTSIDLLTQAIAESSEAAHPPPISPLAPQDPESDPFDTSAAEKLLVPGKSEIKLLEQELLNSSALLSQLEDEDFDPRAGDPSTRPPPPPPAAPTPPTAVRTDYLEQRHEEESLAAKPLTPAANSPEAEDYDPFDTSRVSSAPGKSELKLIEKELEAADVADDKFDPRAFESANAAANPTIGIILNKYNVSLTEPDSPAEPAYVDILTGDEKSRDINADDIPPPVEPEKLADPDDLLDDAYVDPFDTSIADHIAPGKTELKLLENELID